jgi:predicted  nucleic acid-binding Zn-ribbon protein
VFPLWLGFPQDSLVSDLLELVSLQALDNQLDQARAHLTAIEERLAGNDAIAAAQSRLAESSSALAELATRQRKLDGQLQDITARIDREEARLYAMTNYKEAQALQSEVEHFKQERSGIEGELLETLGAIESASAEHKALEDELSRLNREWDSRSADLRLEAESTRGGIGSLEQQRGARTESITIGALRLYDGLRRRKGGIAVARVVGSSCSGCRVAIPDAIRRRIVNSPTLVQCPHCERILALS